MHDLSHRAAVAALFLAGSLMAASPWALGADLSLRDGAMHAVSLMWQGQFLLALLGLGVVAAALMPALRPAALGAAILSKLGVLVLAPAAAASWQDAAVLGLLVGAAAVFAREAWLQARWDGVLPLRQEW
jgi:hypothetical protein